METLDWSNLGFGYRKTDGNVRCHYKDGAWGEVEVCTDENISLHMAATCLHYGQDAFEGLKAFRGKDGKVRIFRLEANAERLQSSCDGIMMPRVSTELFREMVTKVVALNEDGTLLINGDAQSWTEVIRPEQILAHVTHIRRRVKVFSVNARFYRMMVRLWMPLRRAHPLLMKPFLYVNSAIFKLSRRYRELYR